MDGLALEQDNIRHRIYDVVLGRGEEGRKDFLDALRAEGIAPTPADEAGHLYAPNPVVVPRAIVDAMVHDLNVFCQARRARLKAAADLLEHLPSAVRENFASEEVASQIFEQLKLRHPFACLDAYLVQTEHGLDRAYLEWQTFPAYPTLGLKALNAARRAYPGIEDAGGSFSGVAGQSIEDVRAMLAALYLRGIDDARQGVIVDWEPERQVTRREFAAIQEVTGGKASGFGIIDPRAIRYVGGRPTYRRDGCDVPIVAAMSRLVDQELEEALLPALGAEEREHVTRFFKDGTNVRWIVHPIHFLYGSKGDFPGFYAESLSPALPACRVVTQDLLDAAARQPSSRLRGAVMKPVTGCGGRDVLVEPKMSELVPGAIIQEIITPAECHRTLDGLRAPEIRVMGLPDADGRLISPVLFARVKSPNVFKSNAGATAADNHPGTGEGYALVAG